MMDKDDIKIKSTNNVSFILAGGFAQQQGRCAQGEAGNALLPWEMTAPPDHMAYSMSRL